MDPPANRPLRVVMANLDPRHPGGMIAVIESWRRAGLERSVELVALPTSAWDSPLWRKLAQFGRAVLRLLWTVGSPRRRPDLVHLHASTGLSLLRKLVLSWCCRLTRVPYVAQMHSGGFDEWLEQSSLNRRAARSLFSRAEVVVVLAERWRASMVALGAGRIEVIPNGIAEPDRVRLERAARIRAARSQKPDFLLFYGRWAPVKGADRLAAALRSLDRDDFEVHLYGNGDREWLEAQFADLRGRVSIGGWLDGEGKVDELGNALALVAPSRAEGFPSALVEARAAGVPVIATDVGAVREALEGYASARVIDADDEGALQRALREALDGDWPVEGEARGEDVLPGRLRSEDAVGRLVEIYAAVAAGGRTVAPEG